MVHDQLHISSGALSISSNSTAALVTGGGGAALGAGFDYGMFEFNLTAVPAGGAPTLDVYLQTSVDLGVTWRDVAHPAQFTTATVVTFCQVQGQSIGAAAFLAASDAALAVNTTVQGPWGDRFRLKWVFVAGGSSGPYTLAVDGILK